ncbi:MAG: hypothetical protein QM742_16290 [Aquabacterium sp.]
MGKKRLRSTDIRIDTAFSTVCPSAAGCMDWMASASAAISMALTDSLRGLAQACRRSAGTETAWCSTAWAE